MFTIPNDIPQCSLQHYLQYPGHGSNLDEWIKTDEWIKKMWYIYAKGYYSVLKMIEIGSFVVMWVEVQSITKSEVSWKKKSRYHILMHTHIYIC